MDKRDLAKKLLEDQEYCYTWDRSGNYIRWEVNEPGLRCGVLGIRSDRRGFLDWEEIAVLGAGAARFHFASRLSLVMGSAKLLSPPKGRLRAVEEA